MSTLILTSTRDLEFKKKLETQFRLNSLLIASNFIFWIATIFLVTGYKPAADSMLQFTTRVATPHNVTIDIRPHY